MLLVLEHETQLMVFTRSLWPLVLLFKIYVVLSYLAAIGSTCTAIQIISSGGKQAILQYYQ